MLVVDLEKKKMQENGMLLAKKCRYDENRTGGNNLETICDFIE